MRVSYMAYHVAVQDIDTKVPSRSLAAPRACFPPPCRAELHRSASLTASICCSRRHLAGRELLIANHAREVLIRHFCARTPIRRGSRTADVSDQDTVPSILPSARQGSRLHNARPPRSLVGRLSPNEGFETPKQREGVIGPSPLGKFRRFECRKTQTGKREGGTDRTTL
jgi:hypothetical protein